MQIYQQNANRVVQNDENDVSQVKFCIYCLTFQNSEEMGECLDVGKIQCYNVTELLHREL